MQIVSKLAVSVAIAMASIAAPAQSSSDAQLSKVLSQMNAAAAQFASAGADFTWDQLTAVVQEHDIQKGTIAFRRGAKGTAMVAHVVTEDGQPAPKDVLFRNGELKLYQPAIKQETILPAGGNREQFESFATLGFGGSGKDLQANWNVSYSGSDTMDGVSVAKLTLAPKHPAPNQMFTHIEIWIDPATATSHKQVFYTSSGDTRTAIYTNIKLNSTPESAFTLKVPSGTQVVRK
jgi:outer membrane lipoprotein-sorting protein